MFCGNCGKKLIDGSLFCIECGTPVPVGRFAGTSPAAQQPSAFSGSDKYNGAESSYNAPNEADLFGTNSFSEEAISAFSGAMNAFGAQGFQVPTVEDVDLSTGRIRQKAPKNKGDDILVENFSMTDGTADTEFIEDRLPVVEGCSMDEDISKDVIIDPYRFLGDSMEDMSMDSVKPEMPTASAAAAAAVEPVSVEPISFSAGSHENHFANLAAEPDIQPSVSVEPVFPMRQNAVEPAVEEKGTEPVEQISVSVVEQVAVAVSEQAAVPVVEPITTPVIEQISVPAVEKAAEPVVEQAAVPKAEPITAPVIEPISVPAVEKAAEPVVERAAVPKAEPITAPVIEPISVPVVEKAAEPVVEQAAVPKAEPITTPVIEPIAAPVAEQIASPVIEQAEKPVIEQTEEPVIEQTERPVIEQAAKPSGERFVPPPMTEPPVIQQDQPKQQPSSYEPPLYPAPQKKGIPIWLFILVLLGLIAVVVILFLNMNN